MPWEDDQPQARPAAAAMPVSAPAASGPMPWEDTGATSTTTPAPHRYHPTTWSQDREKEMVSHPLYDKITEYREPDFSHPVQAAGTVLGNLGGRAIRTVGDFALPGGMLEGMGHFARHPMDSTSDLVDSMTDPGPANKLNRSSGTLNLRKALKTGTEMAAQAPAAIAAGESVGPLTKAVGQGVKGMGRVAGEVTLGTDAVDRANARPGAGVSENRVVAMTRPGLQQRIKGKIGPLKDQEMDVLNQHANRGPIDTRTAINEPFNDTIARTTNYRTGVGSRPEMQQHWSTLENLNYVQDPKGGLLRDPITQQPFPKGIDDHTPAEAAQFKSNLYRMTDYDTAGSGLANADLKRAGGNLKDAIVRAVPEATDITNRLHNSEAAVDVLNRQRGHSLAGANPLSRSRLIDMVRVPLGSSAAAGLDLLGSGLMRAGDLLSPGRSGGGTSTSPTNPPGAPQGPVIRGQLPTPPAPLPQGQPALASGHVVTPAPSPTIALPGSVEGPLTRVVTRSADGSKFGPKVEAPAFSKPVGRGPGRYGGESIMSPEADRRNAADNKRGSEAYMNRRKGDKK
jgi:hypothetical protein